ncbi:hypothetical protein J53TS2_37630 [Paenibacillus sp. J53TS2]|nr:hypothetical protein J53TS2_37630 [Paenibacillus sp. J53TS2]
MDLGSNGGGLAERRMGLLESGSVLDGSSGSPAAGLRLAGRRSGGCWRMGDHARGRLQRKGKP